MLASPFFKDKSCTLLMQSNSTDLNISCGILLLAIFVWLKLHFISATLQNIYLLSWFVEYLPSHKELLQRQGMKFAKDKDDDDVMMTMWQRMTTAEFQTGERNCWLLLNLCVVVVVLGNCILRQWRTHRRRQQNELNSRNCRHFDKRQSFFSLFFGGLLRVCLCPSK